MSGLLRYFLGFILLVATVGLATCQSMVKAEPAAVRCSVYPHGIKVMTSLNDFKKPKRFIGKKLQDYSPRGLLLYFLPWALIPATIMALGSGNLLGIIVNASGFALYMAAAWCLRKGLQAEAAFSQAPIARAPRWPLKSLAAVITALATGMIAWLGARHALAGCLDVCRRRVSGDVFKLWF